MRIFKNAAVILLALCLLSGLSGCCGNKTGTEWKEELLGSWNNFMQDFSRYALTSQKCLGMRIRYFKDESDFKTTQFLTDEKTPQCPSLKK